MNAGENFCLNPLPSTSTKYLASINEASVAEDETSVDNEELRLKDTERIRKFATFHKVPGGLVTLPVHNEIQITAK